MIIDNPKDAERLIAGRKVRRIKNHDDAFAIMDGKPRECLECKKPAQYESYDGHSYFATCIDHIPEGNEVVGML